MRPGCRSVLALALLVASPLLAASTDEVPAASAPVDLPALIECRLHEADFRALAPVLADPHRTRALGWTPLPARNPFMTEYTLAAPIRVFGHATRHIAFASAAVMAVLDLPDPRPLAHRLGLETGVDNADKVLYGREVLSRDTTDPDTGAPMIESIVLSVSNVRTHPGQTLAGCSYSLDLP